MIFSYFINRNNATISLDIGVCVCTLHIILACDKHFVLFNKDILCKILEGRMKTACKFYFN